MDENKLILHLAPAEMQMVDDCFCPCKTCTGSRTVIKQAYDVLKLYGWILDAYVVDFFYEDLWTKLPLSWQNAFKEITPRDLGCWFSGESKQLTENNQTVLPLSLIALRQVCDLLQISRNHKDQLIYECCKTSKNASSKMDEQSENEKIQNSQRLVKENNLLFKHVKCKKKYEIKIIGQIVSDMAKKTNNPLIIDIGAGKGHFSRWLAVKYDLQVLNIEQNDALLQCSKKYDQEFSTTMGKHFKQYSFKNPYYLNMRVTSSLTNSLLNDNIFENMNLKNGFAVVGLHPCGDLAVNLLRLYSNCSASKCLCIIGCCYMKLYERNDTIQNNNYPMSVFISKMPNNKFSYNALEGACHAKEKHFDKMKCSDYDELKIHTYRAVLECLLAKIDVKNRHEQMKNIKLRSDISFQQYCHLALENSKLQNALTLIDFESQNCLEMLNRWKEVLYFISLRLTLAPLVETVVLLDRFLYLSENNLRPSLKAGFDCRTSPRNFVLTSFKS